MARLRGCLVVAALTGVSLVGIPLQWLALRLDGRAARAIPVAYHRTLCRILGLRRTVSGTAATDRPLLLVANHVSWLDIVVLSAVAPVSFVAKSEVAGWPVFGLFARLQRSVFVDRQRRRRTGETGTEIAHRLAGGDVLVLFAEGTSSDHNRVLPFRTALLGAVREASLSEAAGDLHVQPLSIAYTGWNGLPIGRRERPRVAWYGDMDLAPHLWRLVCEGRIDAHVSFGEAMPAGRAADRRELARRSEAEVRRLTNIVQRGRA